MNDEGNGLSPGTDKVVNGYGHNGFGIPNSGEMTSPLLCVRCVEKNH
jgi:hypothetical protein